MLRDAAEKCAILGPLVHDFLPLGQKNVKSCSLSEEPTPIQLLSGPHHTNSTTVSVQRVQRLSECPSPFSVELSS